jgi:ADP-heptose:LPS heptosyltransferase
MGHGPGTLTESPILNVRALTKIDRWLGVPLCFALTCFKYLTRWPKRADANAIQSILFIKLAEQGSTVLAHLALEKALQRVGRENVLIVVFEDNRFIVDVLGLIPPRNVLTISSAGIVPLVRGAMRALRRLWRLPGLAVIDLEFFSRASAAFAYVSGAALRVGFHAYFGEGPYRGNLMTHRIRYNPHLHTGQTFALLVDALSIPPDELPRFNQTPPPADQSSPYFKPAAGEVAEVEGILKTCTGISTPHPLVLLNANASDLIPLRRWGADRYVELATRLLAKYDGMQVAFTGAPDEAAKVEELVRRVHDKRSFSLAGKTTLRQLMVLYGMADVLVTNDSGPAHFAALTPIHTVTLFGPETPLLFAAATPRNTAITAGLACSPCVSALNNRQSACKDNVCMKQISVEQVFDAVCASLRKRSAQRLTAAAPTGARIALAIKQ